MKWVERIEENFIGISLLIVTFVLFLNVLLRYVFNASSTWAEEFIRYVMIWITFIGSSVCFRKGFHVGIDFILSFTSNRLSRCIHVFVVCISIVFMVFVLKYGFDLFIFSKSSGQITPAMQIPLFWVYLAIPLSALLSILHLLRILINVIRNNEGIETSNSTIS